MLTLAAPEIGGVFRGGPGRDHDGGATVAVHRTPPSPQGWIITTARNRALDRLRRKAVREDRHAQAALLHAHDEPVEEGA